VTAKHWKIWVGGFIALAAAAVVGITVDFSRTESNVEEVSDASDSIGRPFELIVDQSNEQVYSTLDSGMSGMSRFAELVETMGGKVTVNSAPLAEALSADTPSPRILLLGVAMFRRYPKADIEAIRRFVGSGGSVLVLVEHDDLMENAQFQNDLTRHFGIEALAELPRTTRSDVPMPEWVWARFDGGNDDDEARVFLPFPAALRLRHATRPFLTVDSPASAELAIVGAIGESRGGKFAVLGDAEVLWNGTPNMGIEVANNRAFVRELIRLLLPETATSETSPSDSTDPHPDVTELAEAISARGHVASVYPDTSAASNPAGVVVVPPSYGAVAKGPSLKDSDKILIVGDAGSDLLGRYPEMRAALESLHNRGKKGGTFAPSENPLNTLIDEEPLRFLPVTLVQPSTRSRSPRGTPFAPSRRGPANAPVADEPPSLNHLVTSGAWVGGAPITLRRSGALAVDPDAVAEERARILARAAPNVRALRTLTPVQQVGGEQLDPFRQFDGPPPPEGHVVIAATPRVFAIADAELISDPESQTQLFSAIDSWLAWKTN